MIRLGCGGWVDTERERSVEVGDKRGVYIVSSGTGIYRGYRRQHNTQTVMCRYTEYDPDAQDPPPHPCHC